MNYLKYAWICGFMLCYTNGKGQRLTSLVDPFIGSGGHGHVFVGASVPFGAVQLGPDNFFGGWDWCSGYHFSDSIITGFSHTHLSGTGIGDLGDVRLMPYTGGKRWHAGSRTNVDTGYAAHYTHADELVSPGYYRVKLATGVVVELTATERVGFHQYHVPAGKNLRVVIDLSTGIGDGTTDAEVHQVDEHTLAGHRYSKGWANDQRLYFAIRSELPVKDFEVDGQIALISWDKPGALVKLKVGISPVSPEGAMGNIDAELPGWDLAAVKQAGEGKWEEALGRIRVQLKDTSAQKIFYTSLYHTMIDPAIFNDHNGDYRGADKQVHPGAKFTNYSVFSLWDTYRANHPLFTLVQPDRVNDMIQTMLAIYQQQGKLPIWHLMGCETNTMPGTSGVQVVAEAYLKGYRGFDTALALEAIKGSDMRNEAGLDYVRSLGYIPCDKIEESVAKAMEYSISDGSAALMAKAMGRNGDHAWFAQRALSYRHYFDSTVGFFRGRRADGSWNPTFDATRSSHPWIDDYAEGNAWQYLWLVPQDVEGLMRLLGGDKAFVRKLDQLFVTKSPPDPKAPPDIAGLIGQYAHGNEPGHHTTYLYAYGGAQWKTAEKVRYILKEMYQDKPDGISGNEDCGQMSAWYIFSALGFYPVFPASGAYVLGSPLVDKAVLRLAANKEFVVTAVNNGPGNIYIQQVELNGKRYDKSYILHRDIVHGGRLRIVMGSKPNYLFGKAPNTRPRSEYETSRPVFLKNVNIIDGTGAAVKRRTTLEIREGRISRIGGEAGSNAVDMGGRFIMPLMTNVHGHLGNVKDTTMSADNYTPGNVRHQLQRYLDYGVGAMLSMGTEQPVGVAIRDSSRAGLIPGAVMYSAIYGFGVKGALPPESMGFTHIYRPGTVEEAVKDVDELALLKPDAIKIWVDGNPAMKEEIYRAIISEAHKHGIRVASHLYRVSDARKLVAAGVDIIAHSIRDEEIDEALAQEMKRKNVVYIPTLSLDELAFVFADAPEWIRLPFFKNALEPGVYEMITSAAYKDKVRQNPNTQRERAALRIAMKNLLTLFRAGVLVALGTDSGAMPIRAQGSSEHLELQLMVEAGLTPLEAIRVATLNSARALRTDSSTGTLEKGKDASFIVLEKDPSSDIRHTRNISGIWKKGREVSHGPTGAEPLKAD